MKIRRHAQIVPLTGMRGPFDLVPMVNVALLLLFLVPLANSISVKPGSTVELPASTNFAIRPGPALLLTIGRENWIFFRDQPPYKTSDLPLLRRELALAVKETHITTLLIKADKQVAYDLIIQIADAARSAGVTTVNLTSRPVAGLSP